MTATLARPGTVVAISLKMYFDRQRTLDYCRALADLARTDPAVAAGRCELVVLPTFVSIPGALEAVAGTRVRVGAQDLAAADRGAFTGEVSGAELAEFGCAYAEVGHAERRSLFGEDDALVAAKTAAAVRNGLIPIICVGEVERADPATAAADCVAQLRSALASCPAPVRSRIVLAYEPQWAIGMPEPAPVDYVQAVCARLRTELAELADSLQVVYGGSAGPGLLTALGPVVDGLFLGRFAHDPAAVADVLTEAGHRAR